MNSLLSEKLITLIETTGKPRTAKNETFIIHTYNDLEVVYRQSDMYINAGKLCKSQGKDVKRLFATDYWKNEVIPAYAEYISEKITKPENRPRSEDSNSDENTSENELVLFYKLDSGYREFQGFYVHPKLINIIAQWCSIKYNIKVTEYMDSINEELTIQNTTFQQKLQEQQENVSQLQVELKKRDAGRIMLEGELEIIPKNNNEYRVCAQEFKTITQDPNHDYIITYNPYVILNQFKTYLEYNAIDNISLVTDKMNIIVRGDRDIIRSTLTSMANNTFTITKSISELNDIELVRIEAYETNKERAIGLKFELHCSTTHNIPLFKFSSPEQIGLRRRDVGIDLLDIPNKISAQCKCYSKPIPSRALSTYIKCVEHIDKNYTGWKHYLYVLEETTISKVVAKLLDSHHITVIREKYETDYSKIVKETDERHAEFIESTLPTIYKQIGNITYVQTTDLIELCKKECIKYRVISAYLYSHGFESKFITNKELSGCFYCKESDEIKIAKQNIKDSLLSLIEPVGLCDCIRTEVLTKFCKEKEIAPRSDIVKNTLKNLGFVHRVIGGCNRTAYLRENEECMKTYNSFLQNEFHNFIHTTDDNSYQYILSCEVKEYCEKNKIPFETMKLTAHYRSLGFELSHKQLSTKNTWYWVKPISLN